VRLLSRLACALRSSRDRDYSAALARQGLDLARQLDDPPTLVYALTGMEAATWWPENSKERVELGRELIAVGESAGLTEAVIDGHRTLCTALAELGDYTAARRELELVGRAGGPLRLTTQRWLEGAMSTVFALSDGDFEVVEPVIEEMLRQHPGTTARDNFSAAVFQLFLLRREQGRLHEIKDVLRGAAVEFPWYPIHRLALAELLRMTGREGEARSIFDVLAGDGFSRFHRDSFWLPSMCLASEVAVGFGDVELAEILYEELEPFAGLNAVGFPEGSFGSVARYLGLLTGLVDDHDAAVRWFEAALSRNEENGARPWAAHTHYDLAQVLLDRGDDGDDGEAERHLRVAMTICNDIGLPVLQDAVETSLGPHETATHPPPAKPSAVFRRQGEYFSISFNGDAFKMKDTKGLRYLGLLLASPGREIHVLDLVAAVRGADPSRVVPTERLGVAGEAAAPILDRTARAAYTRRLAELQDDLSEAERFGDEEKVAVARREQEFLVQELGSALGLGGRDRMVSSSAERARVNVTRAIRAALTRVRAQSPVLGQHLDSTVKTGAFCSYKPDPLHPFRWQV
jgi:tetratricopeptide (TPR) repeat protein